MEWYYNSSNANLLCIDRTQNRSRSPRLLTTLAWDDPLGVTHFHTFPQERRKLGWNFTARSVFTKDFVQFNKSRKYYLNQTQSAIRCADLGCSGIMVQIWVLDADVKKGFM